MFSLFSDRDIICIPITCMQYCGFFCNLDVLFFRFTGNSSRSMVNGHWPLHSELHRLLILSEMRKLEFYKIVLFTRYSDLTTNPLHEYRKTYIISLRVLKNNLAIYLMIMHRASSILRRGNNIISGHGMI